MLTYDRLRHHLFRLDPERAHTLANVAARAAQAAGAPGLEKVFAFEHHALRQSVLGFEAPNPIGLAAGFDKNARLVDFWTTLGFGFAEVGSVSARPARGNPRPRLFRLPEDRALINRMGLNNDGAARVAKRLRGASRARPLGVNLAKTHDPSITGEAGIEDFRTSFVLLAPHADYVTLNISCPNTAEGKTFEDPETLDALLEVIVEERKARGFVVPVLVKVGPSDSGRVVFDSLIEEVVSVALDRGVHGFVATNTASDRQGLTCGPDRLEAIGRGGLSGAPLATRATGLVRYLYGRTGGRLPIIGVGGVASADDAYAKIRAGASLVQLYTGLVYEGPGLVRRIKEGLVERLAQDGFASVRKAVGVDA